MSFQPESFERLFEKIQDGMMILDRSWKILYANDMARRYLGISPTADHLSDSLIPKLSGKYVLSGSGGEIAEGGGTEPMGEDEDEMSIIFEASSPAELSSPLTLSIYMSRPTDDGMRFLLLRDVTEERNEDYCKVKFLSLVSHKLMTPINIVKMTLSNLFAGVDGEISEMQRDTVKKSMGRVESLEKMVLRLIDYASLQAVGIWDEPDPLDAYSVMESFFAEFKKKNRDREIVFKLNRGTENADIAVREHQLISALDCIFENSVKFHGDGTVKIDVSVERVPDNGELEIVIEDDGPGIPPSIQRNILKEFVQRDDDFTGNTKGLGLGLPLLMGFMKIFKGRVSLESEQGVGTTIRLTFPKVS
jgi:signal transduction histidine kinase